MSKTHEEEAPSPNLTDREVYLLELMGKAIGQRRIHPGGPNFTSRALADAMDNISSSVNKIGEREVGPLLDRMGVFMNPRTYRRKTAKLLELMPEWLAAAENEKRKSRERETETPRLPSRINITR